MVCEPAFRQEDLLACPRTAVLVSYVKDSLMYIPSVGTELIPSVGTQLFPSVGTENIIISNNLKLKL
jgi:hypothetical protein